MNKILTILKEKIGLGHWKIEKPKDGYKKECYIVSNGNQKYFLKFDIPIEALIRLGKIQVAPKVIASDKYKGTDYVIQEFIDGVYPDREWIKKNYQVIAQLIKTYHNDKPLLALLAKTNATEYKSHINNILKKLDEQYKKLLDPKLHQIKIEQAFSLLKEEAKLLNPVPLVPIHKEPNTKNMLKIKNRIVFIDWDEITLSDPIHDLSLFLWWYLPKEKWTDFLQILDITLDEKIREKIYWFSAKSSLEIALWCLEHGHNPDNFINDFIAAINKQSNPEAY